MAADQVNLEKTVEKKLHMVNNTQDSIQGLSLWILHRKSDAETIVKSWAKIMKKSKTNHRLTLFYLCNDVVQNSKRKNAKLYIDLFKVVLKEIVPLVRHESVRATVRRIFGIWEERGVFNEEFILEMQELLVTEEERQLKKQQEVDAKLLAEFKPQVVVETLRGFRRFETELDTKQRQISSYRIDASTTEKIKRLKDRRQGAELNHQFEEAHVKLDDYIQGMERVIKERAALIDLLAMTEHFFELQYGEAKVVANAYKNFGTRVNKQRKHLEEVKRTLPEVMSPLPSPCIDAPSPTGSATPPDLAMPSVNNQVIDMELDEEATAEPILTGGLQRRAYTTTINTIVFPISSVTQITMGQQEARKKGEEAYSPRSEDSAPSPEGSPIDLQLSPDTTKEDMDIVKGTSHIPQYSPRGAGAQPENNIQIQAVYNPRVQLNPRRVPDEYNPMNEEEYIPQSTAAPVVTSSMNALAQIRQIDSSGDSTPVKDEGDTTPTQDEFPESAQSNPVDFLTRLINQSKKSTELSPSLLQNLSMLRETVKKQATVAKLMEDRSDKEQSRSPTPSGPSSWAAWKAQKQASSLTGSSAESTPIQEQEPVANPIHNGRKSLDERLQEQLEDAARIANAPPNIPPPPMESVPEHYTLVPDDYVHPPVPNEALRRLNPIMPVQTMPTRDLRLSFSPPPPVSEPEKLQPVGLEENRPPIVIQFNQPKKSILKNSSNITVCMGGTDATIPSPTANPESPGLSIPTIGGILKRPLRPPFPPRSGSIDAIGQAPTGVAAIRPPGPPPPPAQTSPEKAEVQNEFINKLKQKTATTTPSTPVQRQNSNSNLSNLRTVITVDAGLPPPPPPPGPPPANQESDQYPPSQYEPRPDYSQPPQQYDPTYPNPDGPPGPPPFGRHEPPPAFEQRRDPPPFDPNRPPPTSAPPPFDPSRPPPNFDFMRPPPGIPTSPRGPPPADKPPSTPETPPAEPHPYSPDGPPLGPPPRHGDRRDSRDRREHFPGDERREHFPGDERREHFPGDAREHFHKDRHDHFDGPKKFPPRPPFDDERPPPFLPPSPGWRPPPPPERFDRYRDHYGQPMPKRHVPPPRPGFDPFFPRRY